MKLTEIALIGGGIALLLARGQSWSTLGAIPTGYGVPPHARHRKRVRHHAATPIRHKAFVKPHQRIHHFIKPKQKIYPSHKGTQPHWWGTSHTPLFPAMASGGYAHPQATTTQYAQAPANYIPYQQPDTYAQQSATPSYAASLPSGDYTPQLYVAPPSSPFQLPSLPVQNYAAPNPYSPPAAQAIYNPSPAYVPQPAYIAPTPYAPPPVYSLPSTPSYYTPAAPAPYAAPTPYAAPQSYFAPAIPSTFTNYGNSQSYSGSYGGGSSGGGPAWGPSFGWGYSGIVG
jgi:hypothetical protein